MNTILYIEIAALVILSGGLIILCIQATKLWKTKKVIEGFLSEIKFLNFNLKNAIDLAEKGKRHNPRKVLLIKRVCENCKFRQTFCVPESENVFKYYCKIKNKEIKLNNTCNMFKKVLQNTNTEK